MRRALLALLTVAGLAVPAAAPAATPPIKHVFVIVLDNMLRGGAVLEEGGDDGTVAIRDLSARLAADDRVAVALLPVRDGMTIVRRTGP